jgi:hypothetical protein
MHHCRFADTCKRACVRVCYTSIDRSINHYLVLPPLNLLYHIILVQRVAGAQGLVPTTDCVPDQNERFGHQWLDRYTRLSL